MRSGVLLYATGPNESLGEKLQQMIPKAHVVKSFNSVGAAHMVNPHYEQGTPTMFLCGDDEGAKAKVSAGSSAGSPSTAAVSSRPAPWSRRAYSGPYRVSCGTTSPRPFQV